MEKLEKSITTLRDKLTAMDSEFRQTGKKARELADAQRTIEEYLRQEQSRGEQKRKRNAPRKNVILLRTAQELLQLF